MTKTEKSRKITALVLVLTLFIMSTLGFVACDHIDYANKDMWAYYEQTNKAVDCFLICPTVYMTDSNSYNMPLSDEQTKQNFVGALNMERGIYDDTCNMYAPFYRQVALEVYKMDESEQDQYFEIAYNDVRNAFLYYINNINDGRPYILAGFSQGADMCIRLMQDLFDDQTLSDQLIACYAIGWRITDSQLQQYPQLKMAQGELDTGVIISFNTESIDSQTSIIVPDTTNAINPLNWKTDSTYADSSLNLGACFTDYDGNIVKEIDNFCGAYLDSTRKTLKVDSSVTPQEYPPVLDIFEEGIYHLYDYQFFYRNLEQNIARRTEQYLATYAQ